MNADTVREVLVKVLRSIQATSGEECPAITGATKPVEDLPKFDSKMWPVATVMVAKELKIAINDVNVFCRAKSCIALTVDESVAIIVGLANTQATASS